MAATTDLNAAQPELPHPGNQPAVDDLFDGSCMARTWQAWNHAAECGLRQRSSNLRGPFIIRMIAFSSGAFREKYLSASASRVLLSMLSLITLAILVAYLTSHAEQEVKAGSQQAAFFVNFTRPVVMW